MSDYSDVNSTSDTLPERNGNGYVPAKLSLRKLIFYGVSFALFIVIYLKWGEVQDLREIFLKSNISWLLIAAFLQLWTYHFAALNYHYVFRIKGHTLPVLSLYPLALITKFLNQAIPTASISGQIFLIDYLRSRGATVAEGVGRAILEIASLFAGFGLMFVIASVAYLATAAFKTQPEFIYFIYVFIFFAIVTLFVFFIIQRIGKESLLMDFFRFLKLRFGKADAEKPLKKPGVVKKYWSLFLEELVKNMNLKWLDTGSAGGLKKSDLFGFAILWQCMIFLFNILTLYCLALALNIHLSFSIVFIVFMFTQLISYLSFVPGSLVVYEGGMSLLFVAYGVPAGSAFTLALLFRALTFWLPMPVGWLFYRHHENTYHKKVLQG